MIAVTYLVPYLGGAVDAYLTIISVMDMPLFVIAIPYGLLWKKATWQGAMAGYLAGSITGAILKFGFQIDVAPVTIISGAVAALICPIVSLLTAAKKQSGRSDLVAMGDAIEKERGTTIPPATTSSSFARKASLWVLVMGFAVVLSGILMASQASRQASVVALIGLTIYLIGGAWRARSL
jgi:SSS family solute:Na+ symporter